MKNSIRLLFWTAIMAVAVACSKNTSSTITFPYTINVAGPNPITHGVCSGPFVATLNYNGSAYTATTSENLQSTYAEASTAATVYSDSGCTSTLASLTIPASASSVTFYINVSVGNSTAGGGTETLTINGTATLVPITWNLTVN